MNLFFQRILFNISTAAKQFQIIKNKYLVPVKPTRPLNGYMLFCNQKRKKLTTGSVTEKAKALGKLWKELPDEKKKQYNAIYQKQYSVYAEELKKYNQKYVQPFKKASFRTIAMKKVAKEVQLHSIKQSQQAVKNFLEKITPEKKKQIQKELQTITAVRQKVQEEHAIPELLYISERSYLLRSSGDKRLSELTPIERANLQEGYQKYLQDHTKKLAKFADKFNLTLQELLQIINLHQRREKRADIQQVQESNLKKKQAQKKIAKISSATSKFRVKQNAKRVKKVKTTKETNAKAAQTAQTVVPPTQSISAVSTPAQSTPAQSTPAQSAQVQATSQAK